jgi:hypothetical protein
MEESPSETSFEDKYKKLIEDTITVPRVEYDNLLENLKLNAAVCVILLEQAGGLAEFTPEDLAAINLGKVNVTLSHDEERNLYVLERTEDE